MPVPFSQTTRALQSDNGLLIYFSLGLVILLVSLWLYWFFTANIYRYASSQTFTIEMEPFPAWKHMRDGYSGRMIPVASKKYRIEAPISSFDLGQIRTGQKIKLSLISPGTLPRRALELEAYAIDPVKRQLQAYFSAPYNHSDPFYGINPDSLQVAIDQQSPAEFVWYNLLPRSSRF